MGSKYEATYCFVLVGPLCAFGKDFGEEVVVVGRHWVRVLRSPYAELNYGV